MSDAVAVRDELAKPNQLFIVNLSHGRRDDLYITVWRPNDRGYACPLSWAGRYEEAQVREHLDYYNSGDNIAVPCSVIEPLAVAPAPKMIDGDAGPVIPNTAENWVILLSNVIATPLRKPQPMYKGARRRKVA